MSERERDQQPDKPQPDVRANLLDRISKHIATEQRVYKKFLSYPDSFKEIIANVVIDFRKLENKQELLQKVQDEQKRDKYEARYNKMLLIANYEVRKYTLDEIKREIGATLLTNILRKQLEEGGNMSAEEVTATLEFSAGIFSKVLLTKASTETIQTTGRYL